MASQMLMISRVLSLISSLVIPSMVLIIGCLGENLRKISNEAQLSTAALSAYLNEVFPSVLFVKANNAESREQMRFQSLAYTNLSACSRKKRIKVLIPQIVQIMFFGVLFMFSAGSLIVSRGLFECASLISFIGYLVLLIEPIQDMDTSNPAVFVNAELLRMHVVRRVRAAIQVLRSDGGGSVVGKSTDEQQLVIKGHPPAPLTTFVEVIGVADTNQSIKAEIWTNFGDALDTSSYNSVCQLANGDFKHLFI